MADFCDCDCHCCDTCDCSTVLVNFKCGTPHEDWSLPENNIPNEGCDCSPCPDCNCDNLSFPDEGIEKVLEGTNPLDFNLSEIDAIGAYLYYRYEKIWVFCNPTNCDYVVTLDNFTYANFTTCQEHIDGEPFDVESKIKLFIAPGETCDHTTNYTDATLIDDQSFCPDEATTPITTSMTVTIPGNETLCQKTIIGISVEAYFEAALGSLVPPPNVTCDLTIEENCPPAEGYVFNEEIDCCACDCGCTGCAGLPQTLYVTITSTASGMPACMIGAQWVLRGGGPWSSADGTQPVSGCNCGFIVTAECSIVSGEPNLTVTFDGSTNAFGAGPIPVTSTDPLYLAMTSNDGLNVFTNDCDFTGPWDFDFVVTSEPLTIEPGGTTGIRMDLKLASFDPVLKYRWEAQAYMFFCAPESNCDYTIALTNFQFFNFSTFFLNAASDNANLDLYAFEATTCDLESIGTTVDTAFTVLALNTGDPPNPITDPLEVTITQTGSYCVRKIIRIDMGWHTDTFIYNTGAFPYMTADLVATIGTCDGTQNRKCASCEEGIQASLTSEIVCFSVTSNLITAIGDGLVTAIVTPNTLANICDDLKVYINDVQDSYTATDGEPLVVTVTSDSTCCKCCLTSAECEVVAIPFKATADNKIAINKQMLMKKIKSRQMKLR